MGDVVITAAVSTSSGSVNLDDDFSGLAERISNEVGLEVVHEPGACAPCVANRDPTLVPFPGCNGNIARLDSDDPDGDADDAKNLARGNLCRCRVKYTDSENVETYVI